MLLVNASGRIAVGRTIPPAYLADICATLCELAQIEPPRHHVLQGESFAGADVDLARFIVS